MWDFIWHLRGSIPLEPTASNATVLDRVEDLLRQQQKPITHRSAESVSFNMPLWNTGYGSWHNNWLAMVIYDQGHFRIEQETRGRRLRYELRSLHGFLFCLFAVPLFFLFALATGSTVVYGIKLGAFAFSWLYGMNMLLAWLRIPKAIRAAVGNS